MRSEAFSPKAQIRPGSRQTVFVHIVVAGEEASLLEDIYLHHVGSIVVPNEEVDPDLEVLGASFLGQLSRLE